MRSVIVAVDGPRPAAWQRAAVEGVASSPELALAGVRLVPAPREAAGWRMIRAIERRLLGIGADALARVPAPDAPAGERADVLLWLATAQAPPDALRLEPGPGAFARAVADGAATVTTEARMGDIVVARTVSAVRPFSVTLTGNLALWKLSSLAVRAAERAPGLDEPATPAPASDPPSALALLPRAAAGWGRMLATRLLFRRPWGIRVRASGDVGWEDRSGVAWRAGHVYADPFLFEGHLFCEEVPAGSGRGVISHARLGSGEAPRTVLEAAEHLSYPFVFAHGGEVFMVPERSAARRVELYRASDFPHRWELDTVLLDGVRAADATLLEHDGRWWMFVAQARPGASLLDELHLYSAAAPRGPWIPHPANPVVSDVRGARPAGPIARREGRLVRPAQDGSQRYGWAVSFRAIDVLTATEYREHEIDRLEPGDVPGARAVHHHCADGSHEAIDARRRELRVISWFRARSAARRARAPR